MKIKKAKCYLHEMRLKVPYEIAYEHFDSAKNVFIEIESDRGITGFGCAAPDEQVTGETPEKILTVLESRILDQLIGKDATRLQPVISALWGEIPQYPGAIAAVDMALHDMVSKFYRIPLWKMLGGFREKILTSITIGILPVEETIERAKDFIQQGFLSLKIKGGNDLQEDIEKLKKLRQEISSEITIRFDANQGYDAEQAIFFVNETAHLQIEFVEQPIDRNDFTNLKNVAHLSPTPVMADESVVTADDLLKLVQGREVPLINLKLMKNGGISALQQLNAIAGSSNVGVMVGCMDESALGISAGLHFALSHPNIKFADLDGHFDLFDDPFKEAVKFRDGFLYPAGKFGIF